MSETESLWANHKKWGERLHLGASSDAEWELWNDLATALARLEAADEKLAEATWLLQHSEDEDEEGWIQVQWLSRRQDWLAALAREEKA